MIERIIKEAVKRQLERIGAEHGWDVVSEVDTMDGKPVYLLTCSAIPRGAKTGFPHLFSVTDRGRVFELTTEQAHALMASRNRRQRTNEIRPN